MKISFILPIYKVEDYLRECVDSLTRQTYNNFEIILVDDGSPDGCPALCDQLATEDNRIIALPKLNGGLSDARNYGLQYATGDYIIFVDSDDFWIDKDCLQNLMKVVMENQECDFISFNCSYYYSDTNRYKKWVAFDEKLSRPIDKNTAMHSLVASGTMPMSACLKVIKRKSLSDMGLTFIKGILSEDIPWFIDLLHGCNKCMFINQYIYAYRQNVAGSITATVGERGFNDILKTIKKELEKIDSRSFSPEAKDDLRSFLAYEFCILLSYITTLPKSMQKEKRKELLQYKWLLNYTSNPKVWKAALINKMFGIRITEWVLNFYLTKIR